MKKNKTASSSAAMDLCKGCNKPIEQTNEKIQCSQKVCSNHYHLLCVNISQDLANNQKNKWKCPECQLTALSQQKRNDNTPVKYNALEETSLAESTNNITFRRQPQSLTLREYDGASGTMSSSYKAEIIDIIRNEVSVVVREVLNVQFSKITKQMEILEESLKFMNTEFECIKTAFETQKEDLIKLHAENTHLKSVVTALESKVVSLDQESRQSNIEIQCVPEFKNENVVNIVKQICKVVSFSIEDHEILACTRTQKINNQSKKPRAIVCKLYSKLKRDNLLAAIYKYNRTHQKEKLNAGLIGIADNNSPIFVSEHLSPSNKQLHAATRLKAKEVNYKFVWIRNGRIFVRKNELSPAKIISHTDSLRTLT